MNPTAGFSLAQFRWKNRPLIVFAPDENDQLARQRQLLNDASAGLIDRSMVVIEVIGIDSGQILDPSDGTRTRLVGEDVKDLRIGFNVLLGGVAVVLIGKDSEEKYRADDVVEPSTLFEKIDAMPMRQNES